MQQLCGEHSCTLALRAGGLIGGRFQSAANPHHCHAAVQAYHVMPAEPLASTHESCRGALLLSTVARMQTYVAAAALSYAL
jgi:hypothetical protein